MVTDRELLLATAQRRREERLLYYAHFAGTSQETYMHSKGFESPEQMTEELGFFNPVSVGPKRRPDAPVFDYSAYFEGVVFPKGVKVSEDGVLHMPGSAHHFTHLISPLRSVYDFEEILKFPIFKRKEYYDFSTLREQTQKLGKNGRVVHTLMCRLFETSWPLRGYENMLADMLVQPEIAEYFFDLELDWNLEYVTQAALAGVDMLSFGDDVGSQNGMTFSAELWRSMLKPRWAQIFAKAKQIKPDIVLWYHSCGNVTDIIPDLIEIGLDILNPIQPECMDIYGIQRKYGDRLSFDGGIGTQSVLPFGTPQQVKKQTEQLVETFGANGGLILSPSHVIEPEVPFENLDAFVQSAQRLCRK